MEQPSLGPDRAARWIAPYSPALLQWFADQHLGRVAVEGDAEGTISEIMAPPVLLLGPGDTAVFACPDPDPLGYLGPPLAAMTLDDYHLFLLDWLTRAVADGWCHCVVCGQPITADPAAPWDGIFVDKELVGWLIIHFDCKRGLARAILGRTAFDVLPLAPATLAWASENDQHTNT